MACALERRTRRWQSPCWLDRLPDRVVATLNRPEKRNAIDQDTIDALHALCAELEAAPRTLILTGVSGVFASGADIAQLRDRRAARRAPGHQRDGVHPDR